MQSLQPSGFAEFDRLTVIFRRTRDLLDVAAMTGDLSAEATEVLATETLPHVDDIEQGFRVWLRASAAGVAELRALVTRAGIHAADGLSAAERRAALVEAMHEIALANEQPSLVPAPVRALAALEHARLVFALLPATPAADVHYPAGRRSYGDILPPRGAAELADRIEELERSLWSVATGRLPRLSDGRYRRTYGFFDTAARISGSHFLIS